MRLTTRGRYAVTALLDLALQTSQQESAVSLSDIAKGSQFLSPTLNSYSPSYANVAL